MTISCPYTEGGALAGGNGIVVNAGATDVVVIRGLDIFGVSPPSNGIRFLAGAALHVEDSVIRRFNAAGSFGISFQPSGSSRLYVSNTRITNNGNGATGGGILVQPTGAAGNAAVELNNVGVQNNANAGLRVDTTGNTSITGTGVAINNSSFSGSTNGIIIVETAGNSNADATVNNSTIAHNNIGISAGGSGSATIRVANSLIMGNGTGVQPTGGGAVRTYGSNLVDGNTTPGVFTGAVLPES